MGRPERGGPFFCHERVAQFVKITILDVSRNLDVGWDMGKDIRKRDQKRRYQYFPMKRDRVPCHRRVLRQERSQEQISSLLDYADG
jgi:hypothetical protein